jgi:hypothetical protein
VRGWRERKQKTEFRTQNSEAQNENLAVCSGIVLKEEPDFGNSSISAGSYHADAALWCWWVIGEVLGRAFAADAEWSQNFRSQNREL